MHFGPCDLHGGTAHVSQCYVNVIWHLEASEMNCSAHGKMHITTEIWPNPNKNFMHFGFCDLHGSPAQDSQCYVNVVIWHLDWTAFGGNWDAICTPIQSIIIKFHQNIHSSGGCARQKQARSNASGNSWLPVVKCEQQMNRKLTADLALETWAWERTFDRQSKPI